jgi:hypothetical protein
VDVVALAGLSIIRPPHAAAGDVHSWHLYVTQLAYGAGVARDVFIERLFEQGIGCSETVVHGDNGFLVPVQDAEALAQAMRRFIEEPDLQTSMGARSRQMAEDKYDVHKVNAVMLAGMGLESACPILCRQVRAENGH